MESTSIYRQIRTGAQPPAGRGAGKKSKTAQQPPGDDRSNFLRSCFVPVSAAPPGVTNVRTTEKQFFRSVNYFTQLYELPVPDVSEHIFPFNIHKAYTELQESFKNKKLDLIIVRKDNKICLATAKEYDIGYHSLYYMPLLPLVYLLEKKKRKQANLLLSVFAYLYMVQDIPYYGDSSSYLFNCHECIENFIKETEEEYRDPEDYLGILSEFKLAEYWGNRIHAMLRHPYTLQNLQRRVEQFRPKNDKDKALLEIGQKAVALSEKYPTRSILGEMPRRFLYPSKDDYDEEQVIAGDQLVSFSWSSMGFLHDYLIEHINCDLQEMGQTDFPFSLQLFNRQQKKEQHDLSFTEQTFDLLSSLCDYLY